MTNFWTYEYTWDTANSNNQSTGSWFITTSDSSNPIPASNARYASWDLPAQQLNEWAFITLDVKKNIQCADGWDPDEN